MVTRYPSVLAGIALALCGAACSSSRPYVAPTAAHTADGSPPPDSTLVFRVFLVGDAGGASSSALTLLRPMLRDAGERSAVVFLGDNVYPRGLPDSSDALRGTAEARLRAQLVSVRDYAGHVVFLPGNHDWDDGGADGLAAVRRQEAFVERALARGNTFLPDDGLPGPVEVGLTDDLTLIVLDTQWWLHRHTRAFGDSDTYEVNEAGDVLLELEDLILKHRNEHVLVVGHHPLVSNGPHGGHFAAKDHLTPFPLLGSIPLLYRRFIGRRQDLASERYATLRTELQRLFSVHDGLVYASGHEHSLQYFRVGSGRIFQHYLVSGAASRPGFAARRHGAVFSAGDTPGFLVLQYYDDTSVWLEAWASDDLPTGRLLFRRRLEAPAQAPSVPVGEEPAAPPAADTDGDARTVVTAVNPNYAGAGRLKRWLLGAHHRASWATPVEIPVLDLAHEKGGLTPVKMGGRGQSTSLRMRGGDGHEYVLRSIDKVAGRVWPPELQATLARDLLQDQFSMLHPFAAFIVPPLADAAGVYHANPRLFVVPDDPRLGRYRAQMAGRVVLFEERPDDDMSHLPSVGASDAVVGYSRLFRELNNDNDHRVDARSWIRARLFDMLIADWDRHEDQWRWASFEPYELDSTLTGDARTAGKIYRPIPRDRDVAFMRFDGLLPTLASYTVLPRYQDFEEHYGDLRGLNLNGLAQDRRFAAAMTPDDWVAEAESLRLALTDAVIEDAVHRWPEPIFARTGEPVIATLKTRRDALPGVALRYARMLARVVDVVGSNKHERFTVTRREDGRTEVIVHKTTKAGDQRRELYRRTLDPGETREIRLYGLGGNDRFVLQGEGRTGILVRAVGGPGDDELTDRSRVRGRGKQTRYYDTSSDAPGQPGPETRVIQSSNPSVNAYDPFGYRYDDVRPVAFFGFNTDDGVFLGGGVAWTRQAFRAEPFARQHRLVANGAARTGAFNARYRGLFIHVVRGWDVALDASVYSPNSIRNFYGLGNETTDTEGDATFYQARLSRVTVVPSLRHALDEGVALHVSPTFEYTDVRLDDDRFVARPQAGISPSSFEDQWFGGVEIGLTLDATDETANPRQGFRFDTAADVNVGLRNASQTYTTFSADLVVYYSPSLSPQVTLAVRGGGTRRAGDFPFYAAGTLGGATNLRGYRSTRFAGRTAAYQNLDLRVELARFAHYVGYGTVGLLGFLDHGRVWTDGESSHRWHRGYGGGLWLALLNEFVLTATYGRSETSGTFALGFGFQF